jgi:mercuric ion transport protein
MIRMAELSTDARPAAAGDGMADERGSKASIGLMILGALAMTSCCILPLAFVMLGVTGVFIGKLGALYQYHWYFLAFALGALAYGFYKAYKPVNAENCADGSCARPMNRTVIRSVMWLSLVIVAGSQLFQLLAPTFLSPF